MRQEVVKKEVRGFAFDGRSRKKEDKIISAMNEFIKEINEKGGEVKKYEIVNEERMGKNISIMFLVNWE